MKTLFTAAIAATLFTTTVATADGFKRIKKEADLRALTVGKILHFAGGSAVLKADGKP